MEIVRKVKKQKIAVCLPTYNESKNIRLLTKKIDRALSALKGKYHCYIVNADNNSPDKTNEIFNNTYTRNEKISIISKEVGKGINIINFMNFCKNKHIDYAFMIDSDLKSFNKNWIRKMLNKLNNSDFVCPLYKRSRFEGNTTNHFVVPIINSIYGRLIRQPIGGDYAFNKRYINLFNSVEYPNIIKQYGIDIFLVLLALNNNLKVNEVKLGKKIHNPSYMKMDKIFKQVARSLEECTKLFPPNKKYTCDDIYKYNSISNKKYCSFYKIMIKNNKYDYEDESKIWINEIINYLSKIKNNESISYDEMTNKFKNYSFSYWYKYKYSSSIKCEKAILNFCYKLKERCDLNVNEIKL